MARALKLFRQGAMREAASVCEGVLREQGGHFDALHLLGVIHLQSGQIERGLHLVERAIEQRPHDAAAYLSKSNALMALGRPQEALEICDRALALQPTSAIAHNNRANALLALGRADEALVALDRALEIDANYVSAYSNRGSALLTLKRATEALVCLDKAIALNPNHAAAHGNRGRALLAMDRPAEALESHDRALALDPRMVEAWTNKGTTLLKLYRPDEALACIDRALELRPGYFNALTNRCQALLALRRPDEALAGVDAVLRLAPEDPKALIIRASALVHLGRKHDALAHLERAVGSLPDEPDLLNTLAAALLMEPRRQHEAAQLFARLLRIDADYEYARGTLCDVLLQLCDWRELPAHEQETLAGVRSGKRAAPPFTLMALQSEAADQLSCARTFVQHALPSTPHAGALRSYRHDRIRLAYLSPDFREHPVANQIVRLLETHDRSRFEVIAVALEKQDGSEVAKRIRAGCDRLFDVAHLHDAAVAKLLRDFEVDIAIDLSGHTFANRIGILAARAAPVQVNYLGFPGTTGTACHDYIVADPWVVPPEHEPFYSERIAWLPHSYQPFDPRIEATRCTMTRGEAGLPTDAFVFCCFNNRFKIHPVMFDVWMRILERVPDSVLWLGESASAAADNLRREAHARGVAPERLLFARRMNLRDEHVARYQLADLFLDTLPFNAHATASDALWAGLPLLTCAGRAFAGRVAAGMLSAAGLLELITSNLAEYEEKAVALAQQGDDLARLRKRLVQGRNSHPLFDIARYRAGLERAYERMLSEVAAGRPLSSFAISEIRT